MSVKKWITLGVIAWLMPWADPVAHPGGIDGRGGHTCRTRCADWGLRNGEYHFHPERVKSSRPRSGPKKRVEQPAPPPSGFQISKRPKEQQEQWVDVERVIDGDTFTGIDQGVVRRFRLVCVDAPELEQASGEPARDRLARFIEDRAVRVLIKERRKDDSGELLGVEVKDSRGRDPARSLVLEGLAWATCETYEGSMQDARALEIGLWATSDPLSPWAFRKREFRKRAPSPR